MNNDSRFSSGFLMGLLIGSSAVFLLGTRTGKNLLKIVSEQGLDGLINLLEEYGLESMEEEEEPSENSLSDEKTKENSKRRFFKRVSR